MGGSEDRHHTLHRWEQAGWPAVGGPPRKRVMGEQAPVLAAWAGRLTTSRSGQEVQVTCLVTCASDTASVTNQWSKNLEDAKMGRAES